jgi:hypothetical protein
VAAAVAFLLNFDPSGATACSCVPFTKPQIVENAAVIFTGTVVSVSQVFGYGIGPGGCNRTSSMDPIRVTFEVETVFKGEVTKSITITTAASSASCGAEFAEKKRYTVFATRAEDVISTNLCRGNVEGAIVAADYGLGAGRPPK